VTRDQERIVNLLSGRVVRNKRGLPQVVYLKEGSAEELEARRALARVLRTSKPLDLGLRFCIADLIDPDNDGDGRRIRFEQSRKGKPSNALAEREVAKSIWLQVQAGVKTESAIKSATQEFGLQRSRILEIWGHWKPILRRLNRRKPLSLQDWF
jgi:hypothetical protein